MKHVSTVHVEFDVGHSSPTPPACEKQHGHAVSLYVSVTGIPMKDWGSYPIEMQYLTRDIDHIALELSNRNLNEMIAPSNPTAAGLAMWVWERLALSYPTLCEVEVTMGGMTHRIEP